MTELVIIECTDVELNGRGVT